MKKQKIFFTAKNGMKIEVTGFNTNPALAGSFLKETGLAVADGAVIPEELTKDEKEYAEADNSR